MASIRKDRAENQPVEMILSDAEVAAVLTTSQRLGPTDQRGQVLKARQPH
jgi:hypothetical protein